jgi:hypothetical protein
LGAKPTTGNPGYGVSSIYDDEINTINDLREGHNFRNYAQPKTRAARLLEILAVPDEFNGGDKNKASTVTSLKTLKTGEKKKEHDPYQDHLAEYRKKRAAELMNLEKINVEEARGELNLVEGSNEEARSWGVIENSSSNKLKWDLFIVILAIFNTCTIPVAIAFSPPWSTATWYIATDAILNFFYLIDIGVQFSTSYVSGDGFIVYERKKIAWRYLFNGFFVDLLSSIPYS